MFVVCFKLQIHWASIHLAFSEDGIQWLRCGHWLHKECLTEALEMYKLDDVAELKCPLCKTRGIDLVDPDVLAENTTDEELLNSLNEALEGDLFSSSDDEAAATLVINSEGEEGRIPEGPPPKEASAAVTKSSAKGPAPTKASAAVTKSSPEGQPPKKAWAVTKSFPKGPPPKNASAATKSSPEGPPPKIASAAKESSPVRQPPKTASAVTKSSPDEGPPPKKASAETKSSPGPPPKKASAAKESAPEGPPPGQAKAVTNSSPEATPKKKAKSSVTIPKTQAALATVTPEPPVKKAKSGVMEMLMKAGGKPESPNTESSPDGPEVPESLKTDSSPEGPEASESLKTEASPEGPEASTSLKMPAPEDPERQPDWGDAESCCSFIDEEVTPAGNQSDVVAPSLMNEFPPAGNQSDVVGTQSRSLVFWCETCETECTPGASVRMMNKAKGTMRCNSCNTKYAGLYRGFGTWPTCEFKGLPKETRIKFYRDVKDKNLQETITTVFDLVESYEDKKEVYACNGEYRPLEYWGRLGYDTQRIEQDARTDDKKECRLAGLCYRVPVIMTGKQREVGMVRKEGMHARSKKAIQNIPDFQSFMAQMQALAPPPLAISNPSAPSTAVDVPPVEEAKPEPEPDKSEDSESDSDSSSSSDKKKKNKKKKNSKKKKKEASKKKKKEAKKRLKQKEAEKERRQMEKDLEKERRQKEKDLAAERRQQEQDLKKALADAKSCIQQSAKVLSQMEVTKSSSFFQAFPASVTAPFMQNFDRVQGHTDAAKKEIAEANGIFQLPADFKKLLENAKRADGMLQGLIKNASLAAVGA